MNGIDFMMNLALWVVGPVISVIITGLLFDRFVIRRIMRNPEVRELLELFREGRKLLKKIVKQNQNNGKHE